VALPSWLQAARDHYTPNPQAELHRRDPAAWARDRLGVHLWSKQRDIFASVAGHRRTAVKSAHGVGKSYSAAVLACWWIDTHEPGEAIVVSTAPTYKQVHAVLWEEIRKHHRRNDLPGTITKTDEWTVRDTLVGMGRKPADHDEHGFQGIHRRYVLAIIDEACGVPKNLYTGVESITTNADCRILAIGNPDDPNTEFGEVCKPGSGWNVLQISSFDSPNFTGEPIPDNLRHLLPSVEWVTDAEKRWGKTSPIYTSKVLGDFPETSENTLIHPRWITAAQGRDLPKAGPDTLGVDVARFGTDRTVIAHRCGGWVRIVKTISSSATTQTAGEVMALQRQTGRPTANVDGVGVGGGVVDLLREHGAPVEDMQAGGGARETERFLNARAEWYWALRERFESGDIDIDPDDDQLAAELGAIRFEYDSRGRIKIESKDDMAARGMHSPDRADALMLAFSVTTKRRVRLGRF